MSVQTKYPVPDLEEVAAAFGDIKHLPRFDALDDEFRWERAPECEIASLLFFRGGRFADHGLRVKPGLDSVKVHTAISAALRSFEPKHEHKIAGVGALIRDWFEPIPDDDA